MVAGAIVVPLLLLRYQVPFRHALVMEVKVNRQLALLIVCVIVFLGLMMRLLKVERESLYLRSEYDDLLQALSRSEGVPAHSFDDGWWEDVVTLATRTVGES